jgi:soluble lytic murein transglycosylase-like protein
MHSKNSLYLLAAIFLAFCSRQAFAETFYSYLDENGTQVFTNIPPVGNISGASIPEESPPKAPEPLKSKAVSLGSLIEKYARDYQLDPSLIHSIIATESGFNPKAISPKGARGLMQLMPATAKRLGVRNSFDPEENIRGGVKHFRFLMDNFNNDLDLSLAAYNAGENLVQRLGRVPEIKETKEYVKSVKKKYDVKAEPPIKEEAPKVYRYYDENGVLNLTNIPPSN